MYNFEKLEVYQRGLDIVDDIYIVTKKYPKEELFATVNQLRRAALSIPLNIAEGSGRSKKDFAHFLNMARTSAFECVALLEISLRQNFVEKNNHEQLNAKIEIEIKMISKLRASISN